MIIPNYLSRLPGLLYRQSQNQSAVITGCARDVASFIPDVKRNMERISAAFASCRMVFCENNSNDETLQLLKSWQNSVDYEVHLISDSLDLEHRVDRIAYSRNRCMEAIENLGWNNCDYIIVMDMDDVGSNYVLNTNTIRKCIESHEKWDAIFANQIYYYYDLFALRTELYNKNPCAPGGLFKSEGKFEGLSCWLDKKYIKKDKYIDPKSGLVPVLSAFGGLGIYKSGIISGLRYEPARTENNDRDCEHVDLHMKIRARGYNRLFIHSALINIHWQ